MKKTFGNIVKPMGSLAEIFNFFMKKTDAGDSRGENSVEADNFVNLLLDEMKDAEQGVFAFFTEFLSMQNLADSMVQIENEVALAGILTGRIKEFLKPDFVGTFLSDSDTESLRLVSCHPSGKKRLSQGLQGVARECFRVGESRLYKKKVIEGDNFSLLAIPLKTTRERYGTVLVGKKGSNMFSAEDATLIMAAAAVVSFAVSNMKLMHSLIKNERLVTIGETIGGLSHDIRNMLNSIENGISVIDTAYRKNDYEMMGEGMVVVKNGYERVKNLVLSMIDYSRGWEINLQKADINGLLKKSMNGQADAIKKNKIKVYESYDEDVPLLYFDTERIDRMFSNLVQNSIDAVAGKKGVIKTGTRFLKKEKVLEIWVKDNGLGIPEYNLDKIFDIFYSTKGSRGTGFGLAIVQKIVREHKGTIRVQSVQGKGTSFFVRIPAKT